MKLFPGIASIVDFWRKMRLDYRLILRSEGDLHAKVNILLRPWNWLVLISTFLVLGWLFFGAILVYTPLGSYLPGNSRGKWERRVLLQSQKIDSLEACVALSQQNLSTLRREILGKTPCCIRICPGLMWGIVTGLKSWIQPLEQPIPCFVWRLRGNLP